MFHLKEKHTLYIQLILQEHLDSNLVYIRFKLNYIRYKTLVINTSQNPFQIILTLFKTLIFE